MNFDPQSFIAGLILGAGIVLIVLIFVMESEP